jgi:hypothetical protein
MNGRCDSSARKHTRTHSTDRLTAQSTTGASGKSEREGANERAERARETVRVCGVCVSVRERACVCAVCVCSKTFPFSSSAHFLWRLISGSSCCACALCCLLESHLNQHQHANARTDHRHGDGQTHGRTDRRTHSITNIGAHTAPHTHTHTHTHAHFVRDKCRIASVLYNFVGAAAAGQL